MQRSAASIEASAFELQVVFHRLFDIAVRARAVAVRHRADGIPRPSRPLELVAVVV